MKLIKDSYLVKILVKDNGEKLVYIKEDCPWIIIRLGKYIIKEGKKFSRDSCFVRKEVAKKLSFAQSLLPKGYCIMLRCGHRALRIQKKRYGWMYLKLKKRNPGWNEERLKEETSKCIAPIDIIPPHSTGGAVDVSIIYNGKQLDMGTKMGEFNEKTYTHSNKISSEAKKNRKLISRIMKKAGFVNYPTEWWHWSYGDRYWAAVLKKKYSIYNGI